MAPESHDSPAADNRDALAALIRAAGRRQPPPADVEADVRAAARAAWQAKLRARRNRRVWYAAAASLLVAAGVAALLPGLLRPAATPVAEIAVVNGTLVVGQDSNEVAVDAGRPVLAGERLFAGTGSGATLTLESGASLRVRGGTTFEFAAPDDIVLLAGTIYVDSDTAATDSPIIVETSLGTVTDIGTQFEVRSGSDALRVRVRSGLIRLARSTVGEDVDGGPGDEIEVGADGHVDRRRVAATGPDWEWAEALAIAPAPGTASILDYFEWIARETGRELHFDSDATEFQADLREFVGDSSGMMPMDLLDYISRTSLFDYEIEPDESIAISRR